MNFNQTFKKWEVSWYPHGDDVQKIEDLASETKLNQTLLTLLYSRGYCDLESIKNFLTMKTERLYDSRILLDIDLATERILRAVENHEKIMIYGDYDVDGVTSVCTLYLYLKSIGAQIGYSIPNRITDGYGITKQAIKRLYDQGANLIITVDNGITAIDEVEYANSLGVDIVVTDHHECLSSLPKANAVVNPHREGDPYPFKELAGVGVVFKVINTLEYARTKEDFGSIVKRQLDEFADLVAIGTIADVMPILDENRLIVAYGLQKISQTKREGIKALLDVINAPDLEAGRPKKEPKITSGFIGFTIAPRLNAAGRLLDASMAAELFLQDEYTKALDVARILSDANKTRQTEENKILKEAIEQIEKEHNLEKERVLVLHSSNWHQGIIGIVASKITEQYGLPCILITFNCAQQDEGIHTGKGSGRSIKGFNLVEALDANKEYLLKYGGHELAAGLSVQEEQLLAFKKAINDYAFEHIRDEDLIPVVNVDLELKPQEITLDLAESLHVLEPFGTCNLTPVFLMREAIVTEINGVSSNKHSRISLFKNGMYFSCMYFSMAPMNLSVYQQDTVDVLFQVEVNDYNGRKSVQLFIKDIRPTASILMIQKQQEQDLYDILNGKPFRNPSYFPTREDFALVYTTISKLVRQNMPEQPTWVLLKKFAKTAQMNYVKLKLIIKVFHELNLLGIEEVSKDYYVFSLKNFNQKTDLDKSYLLKKIKGQFQNNSQV